MTSQEPGKEQSPFNRSAQHTAKRAAILSQAAKLFNSQGSRATTLMDIANSLGLSKTSLYYYVKTKEALIYQCYLCSVEHWHSTFDRADEQQRSPLERIRYVIEQLFYDTWAAQNDKGPYLAQLLEIASLQRDHRKDLEQRYSALVARLQNTIEDGISQGDIAPCDTASTTQALLGAVQWSFNWLHKLDQDAVTTAAAQAWNILSNGLSASTKSFEAMNLQSLNASGAGHTPGFDRQKQQQLKQEAFYKVGTAFFNRKGFTGTSLDEIAEHLNVTKGAFYYHIKNKEDLLFACYERSIDISHGIYEQALELNESGLRQLEYSLRRIFLVQISEQGPLIRYNSITALPMKRRKTILARTRDNRDISINMLNNGIADGSVRYDVNLNIAEHLLSGAINAAMEIDRWRKVDDPLQASADYFKLFFTGLKAEASS